MSTFFPGPISELTVNGGTFNATTNISQSKRGFDLLVESIATDAFHNSDEMYDAPKCHPHTRVSVLNIIMKWIESEAQDKVIMWLFGAAGAGKSAIAKKIAELAMEKGLLIGSFFFSRTSSKRNSKDRLVATLAYQMTVSIPGTRSHIENTIERDPAIFHKDIQTQIDTLIIRPFQSASTESIPSPKLIIIDGLDECHDSQSQKTILNAISRCFATHKLPIRCLVASRPETDLVSSFNGNELLRSHHRRLPLDDDYRRDGDIHRFFSDKFEQIRRTHRLRSTIPEYWPTNESLYALVKKSSGQFIFAATVVRFVESNRHRPAARLDIILGISPPGTINPFTELDALYKQVLSSVENIQLTLRVLSLYVLSPLLADRVGNMCEQFLSLEEGDIDRALFDLSSLVSYNASSGEVKILHASLGDFLSDKQRSDEFYIDMASARTDFACCALQYVKGPDGIQAGDLDIFRAGIELECCSDCQILNGQFRNEILNFDLDTFITAAMSPASCLRHRLDNWAAINFPSYSESIYGLDGLDAINFPSYPESRRGFDNWDSDSDSDWHTIGWIFSFWMSLIDKVVKMGPEDADEQLLKHQCRRAFELRIQKYQSDWHLQLLLTLAFVMEPSSEPVSCHSLQYLLKMDDSNLCIVDQNALGLYHPKARLPTELSDITSRYVDGDRYGAAVLYCMQFLSNTPNYNEIEIETIDGPVTVNEKWTETCRMTLAMLCNLLDRANTSPEVMQFISNHGICSMVKKHLPATDIWRVNAHIVAFLNRGGVCQPKNNARNTTSFICS